MTKLFTTALTSLPHRVRLAVGLLPATACSRPTSRRRSTSTGRPTIRSRWCSRKRACSRRNSPRTASRSAGCRRSAPTRRWNSSMPARSTSARRPAPPRWSSKINGNPIKSIYVYSQPEWTALVTRKDTTINKIEDLKGKRVAVTRGTDPHIFLVRALQSVGLTEKDITPVLLQHPDGKTALIRGDVDAWAGLDPMMAQAEIEDGARLFYRNKAANTWGILNDARGVPQGSSRSGEARARGLRGGAQVLARQLRRGEEGVPGRHQALRRGRRQAAQGAHRAHTTTRSGRSSATRSCRPASPCRRPA